MAEKYMGYFWGLFCCAYFYAATGLSFGSSWAPKAGFLPILAGSTGVFLAAIILRTIARTEQEGPVNWRKFVFWLIGLVFYTALWYFLGYLAATFCMMLYFLKVTDTPGWSRPLLLSSATALIFYLLFSRFLGIKLL